MYQCATKNFVFVCTPTDSTTFAVYQRLQGLIQTISRAMSVAGRLNVPGNLSTITADGRIGPTTALGAQFIAAAFAPSVPLPPELTNLLAPGLAGNDVIRQVAAGAQVMADYFETTYRNFPQAIANDPIVIVKEPPLMKLSPQAAVAFGGFGLATLGGIAAAIFARTGSSIFFSGPKMPKAKGKTLIIEGQEWIRTARTHWTPDRGGGRTASTWIYTRKSDGRSMETERKDIPYAVAIIAKRIRGGVYDGPPRGGSKPLLGAAPRDCWELHKAINRAHQAALNVVDKRHLSHSEFTRLNLKHVARAEKLERQYKAQGC